MPAIKLSPEKVAVVRLLASSGWPHGRIATVFQVDRSTVTWAIANRKTHLPSSLDQMAAGLMTRVIQRTHKSVTRTLAVELRRLADELDAEAASASQLPALNPPVRDAS